MSVVCILAPVVVAGWPAFSAAVAAAATSLGYSVLEGLETSKLSEKVKRKVALEIANSEVVTGSLGRDQRIAVRRQGVTVIFSRDERGRASLCVTGDGYTDEQLRGQGEELSKAVVQSYIYARIKEEMQKREFVVVEEETNEDRSIRLKVRHWEN